MRARFTRSSFGWQRRRPRLQRQLFVWLVLTMCTTVLAVAVVIHVAGRARSPFDAQRVQTFVSERFAESWQDPRRRHSAAESLSRAVTANVTLRDRTGQELDHVGALCEKPDLLLDIEAEGQRVGNAALCFRNKGSGRMMGLLALATAFVVLWKAAAFLARVLTRPLTSLIAVTREIGAGNLKSRVRLHRAQRGELGSLADAINDMAERIERQLNEQRELLAAVSHEVRSPLARLRISSELLRVNPGDARALSSVESEVTEIDNLVGKLLASSRLDFGTLSRATLAADVVALGVLERRELPSTRFEDASEAAQFSADPTLLSRALDNLLDNAEEHGQGLTKLSVRRARPGEHDQPEKAVVFEVCDQGPGFERGTLPRAFEAFFRGARSTSGQRASLGLGLGLSLVERIARAHGGRAWAENLEPRGARVCFSVG